MKVPVVTTTAMTSSSSSSSRMMVIMMALLLVVSSCNAFQSIVLSQSQQQQQQQRYVATMSTTSTTRLYYRDYKLGNGGGGKNGNDDKDNNDDSKIKENKYFFASPIVKKDDDDKKVEKMIIKNFDDFDDFVIGHVVQPNDQEEKPMTVADIWKENGYTAALTLPSLPNPNFSSVEVIQSVLRGLQYNDIPQPNTGLKRSYVFMDIYCKKLVTGYGALREERTLERFIEHSLKSPKLIPFMNAISIEFGPLSKIPGGQWRGEICTMPIKVISRIPPKEAQQPSPESLKFSPTPEQIQNMNTNNTTSSSSSSSIDTTNIDKTAAKNSNSDHDNDTTPSRPPYFTKKLSDDTKEQTFMIRLQKQRRPPLQNCYIITEIIDVQTVESISRPLTRE